MMLSRARNALVVPIAGLALLAPTLPSTSAASAPGDAPRRVTTGPLRISPGHYVGGQTLTFAGNIGRRRAQRVWLQMGSGRSWAPLPGNFRTMTRRDGSFRFKHPAPSMFGLSLRVKGRGVATRPVKFDASSQDLVLDAPVRVGSGDSFTIDVDTTPDLGGRPDLDGLPTFPGRRLTLQRRVDGNRWQDTGLTDTVDDRGNGSFTVTAGGPGAEVYRVRQEDWKGIGWFPSFPAVVDVGGAGRVGTDATTSTRSAPVAPPSAGPVAQRAGDGRVRTASKTHRWGVALWDFAWKYGEALDERPFRGTRRRGGWLDTSTGAGRAVTHNGGLLLDSQINRKGPGDRGTTRATVVGNARAYGRWEATMRLKRIERAARNYHAVIELVPAKARHYACGARNITVADVVANGSNRSSKVRIAANAVRRSLRWVATKRRPMAQSRPNAFAVEVSRRHISWFHNGTLIGTVRGRAAVPGVPMTLRMSLVGNGQREMNKTQFHSDWQRGFSLDRGRLLKGGGKLRRTHHRSC